MVKFTLKMASDRTLLPPTPLLEDFEVSVHTPPRALLYELDMVFPNVDCTKNNLVCILSAQKSKMKLLEWNDEVAKEKDLLLERFAEWAEKICKKLTENGYFADYIDPCSGLPSKGDGNKVYGEVDGFELLCSYKTSDAGGCKVLLHPSWASAVYPASIFSTAPIDLVLEIIKDDSFQPCKR